MWQRELGYSISLPTELDEEPWKILGSEPRFLPVQAQVGDFAIFFRRASVEITFEEKRYLVVPQAAILALIRETPPEDTCESPGPDQGGRSFCRK